MKQSVFWFLIGIGIVIVAVIAFIFFKLNNQPPQSAIIEPGFSTYTALSGWKITYPTAYDIDDSHLYRALGPGKVLRGVSFTVPQNLTAHTNLSRDTYLAVETQDTGGKDCSALLFLGDTNDESFVTQNGEKYSVAHSSEGGAGNIYEEYVYAVVGSSPCTAVRYYIHSTQIENYPADTVIPFDKDSLISVFNAMRGSLLLPN